VSTANTEVTRGTDTDDVRRRLRLPHSMQGALNRWAWDRVAFARDVFDVELMWAQARYLRFRGREMHALAGRRGGKSWTEAIRKMHQLTFQPHTLWYNTARTYHQALIIPHEAQSLCERSKIARHWIKDIDRSPFYRMTWITDAVWEARSLQNGGDNLRGLWGNGVHKDEEAFGWKADEKVIRGMLLDTDGERTGTTTPNGLNFHYHDWVSNETDMHAQMRRRGIQPADLHRPDAILLLDTLCVHWTTYDNPYLTDAAIKKLKRGLSPDGRLQEIDAVFIDVHGALCTERDLRPVEDGGIRDDDLELTEDEHVGGRKGKRWIRWHGGLDFVAGLDLGRWQSYTALAVLRRVGIRGDGKALTELSWLYTKRRPELGWPEMQVDVEQLVERFNATVLIDATHGSVGDAIADYWKIPKEKFQFTKATKEQLLLNLKLAIQERRIRLYYDEELFRQLGLYGTDPDETEGKGTEETWDLVMALALAQWQADAGGLGMQSVQVGQERVIPGLHSTAGSRLPRLGDSAPWRKPLR
jgi:hypothetical protein